MFSKRLVQGLAPEHLMLSYAQATMNQATQNCYSCSAWPNKLQSRFSYLGYDLITFNRASTATRTRAEMIQNGCLSRFLF